MGEALLITRTDLVKLTALGGNVDTDKFIQFIKIAQDIHIQNYLGTRLFVRIKNDIEANTLADPYLSLLIDYIKPMHIHWAMVDYIPFAAYTIANKGVFKHSSENAENVDKVEVDYLVNKERDIAQNYTQRFIDFMSFNSNQFPEYTANSNSDIFPDRKNYFHGWHI